jgi:hypothetical protein
MEPRDLLMSGVLGLDRFEPQQRIEKLYTKPYGIARQNNGTT